MTQFVIVAPKHNPELALLANTSLWQAQWAYESATYENWMVRVAGVRPTILDYQHPTTKAPEKLLTVREYADIVNMVRPTFAVIPDSFQDMHKTIQLLDEFLTYELPEETELMFVPQGKDVDQWYDCLSQVDPYLFGVIGIPKWLHAHRRAIAESFDNLNSPYYDHKVHFLGVWGGASDFDAPTPNVYSWDTSLPIAAAQARNAVNDSPNEKFQLLDSPLNGEFERLLAHLNVLDIEERMAAWPQE